MLLKNIKITVATFIIIAGVVFGAGTLYNKVNNNSKLKSEVVSKEVFDQYVEYTKEKFEILYDGIEKIDKKQDTILNILLKKEFAIITGEEKEIV